MQALFSVPKLESRLHSLFFLLLFSSAIGTSLSAQVVLDPGKLKKLSVGGKTTNLSIPVKVKPGSIMVDPNVNLLATFEVKQAIQ